MSPTGAGRCPKRTKLNEDIQIKQVIFSAVGNRTLSSIPHRNRSGAMSQSTKETGETDQAGNILHRHRRQRLPGTRKRHGVLYKQKPLGTRLGTIPLSRINKPCQNIIWCTGMELSKTSINQFVSLLYPLII